MNVLELLFDLGATGTLNSSFVSCIGRDATDKEMEHMKFLLDFDAYFDDPDDFYDYITVIAQTVAEMAKDF